jgi:uncharacterized protein with HEPN domain
MDREPGPSRSDSVVIARRDDVIRVALNHPMILQSHLVTGSLHDLVVLDAVCLRLASAIDVLNRLDAEQRDALFGDSWHAMWATRNIIAHVYDLIDFEIITATIEQDVPPLIAILTKALDQDQPGADSAESPGEET